MLSMTIDEGERLLVELDMFTLMASAGQAALSRAG
jgi:hypothetical protein